MILLRFLDKRQSLYKINAFCMMQNTFAGWDALVVHGLLHQSGKRYGQFIGLLPAHTDGNISAGDNYKSARSAHF